MFNKYKEAKRENIKEKANKCVIMPGVLNDPSSNLSSLVMQLFIILFKEKCSKSTYTLTQAVLDLSIKH
jgi:hypothetical protein